MIQILLLILKIIGITLLVLLGLVLLVLALVLFVPVFYRVRIVHNPEMTRVNGRVRFLFPLLSVTFQYLQKITYRVRVLGVSVLDSEKPKKEKKDKKSKPRKSGKRKQKKKPVAQKSLPEHISATEIWDKEEPVQETVQHAAEVASEQSSETETTAKEENPPKTGFFRKIRVKIQKVRDTVSNVRNKIKKFLHQKKEVQRILSKPESKQAIAFAWGELKHLIKHILPRKIKGYVVYGSDNPATTGRVLGIIGVVYAKTGQLVEIRPNFEEAQLECDVELQGRLQLFTLLVITVKVVVNQELRQLIADFKNVKNVE